MEKKHEINKMEALEKKKVSSEKKRIVVKNQEIGKDRIMRKQESRR